MELEAENLWVHSASHDFHDKQFSSKIYVFLSKKNRKKFAIFKYMFLKIEKNRKFLLETNIFFSKKLKKYRFFRDFFPLFFENFYIDFQ